VIRVDYPVLIYLRSLCGASGHLLVKSAVPRHAALTVWSRLSTMAGPAYAKTLRRGRLRLSAAPGRGRPVWRRRFREPGCASFGTTPTIFLS